MKLDIVILAAGKGRRMNSDLPKVLQPLAGRPLLAHVIATCNQLPEARVHVVYGHGGDAVRAAFSDEKSLHWHLQAEQLGTGHAVGCAMSTLTDNNSLVLVLYGDVPLVTGPTLERLIEQTEPRVAGHASPDDHDSAASEFPVLTDAVALLTLHAADPTGYGRIVRDRGDRVQRIVEEKDADDSQRRLQEVNTGVLACRTGLLRRWLGHLDNANAQGEYYLTDVIEMAVADGIPVNAQMVHDEDEVLGINDRIQLAAAETALRRRTAHTLMRDGVTLADPARLDVRGSLRCGRDVQIDVNCVFEGEVTLGDRVKVGPGAVIKDCTIAADSVIAANSVLEGAEVAGECTVGPMARLRPGAVLSHGARVGNFVEVKKSLIGAGSKVNHLTYIGDARIGAGVNVGCGTVTCNYDGRAKHKTVIEDGAFVGSGTMLVAPVKVGAKSYIGSGSTITRDTVPGTLTVGRARQTTVEHWTPPGSTED
ncbi:MAG: bifunctional UDP-N-acetylglucosamine diphosphorylase/glucosamine-1-phosphate N-acetyltransferase GlmU [Pseudomonadota bacterium]